jgi:hypothetical protein
VLDSFRSGHTGALDLGGDAGAGVALDQNRTPVPSKRTKV